MLYMIINIDNEIDNIDIYWYCVYSYFIFIN